MKTLLALLLLTATSVGAQTFSDEEQKAMRKKVKITSNAAEQSRLSSEFVGLGMPVALAHHIVTTFKPLVIREIEIDISKLDETCLILKRGSRKVGNFCDSEN